MTKLFVFPDINTSSSFTSTVNSSCAELIWEEGHVISESDYDLSHLEFKCEQSLDRELTDFSVSDNGAPIVSKQVKGILEGLSAQLQFFPATIIKNNVSIENNFYVFNVIGLVDAIDFDKSDLEVEREEGEIVDIIDVETVILKEESFGDMYRLFMYERVIVVENYLADELKKLNISGMKLIEPENWDGIASEK